MSLFNVGRLCVKLAGRDAGRKCVVLSAVNNGKVLVDGNTRRREVSVNHLEPLPETVDLKSGADHSAVSKVFEAAGLKVWTTKARKTGERTLKKKLVKGNGKKKSSAKPVAAKKPAKAPAKKAEAKTEKKVEVKAEKKEAVKEVPKSTVKPTGDLADSLVEKQA
jgi:large subunit ribosomal protein L14e